MYRNSLRTLHRQAQRNRACRRSVSTKLNRFDSYLAGTLGSIKDAGLYKSERVIVSPQTSKITVEGSHGDVLNFCANNYLGLSDHPRLVQAAKNALDSHGFGLSSVRFICGTQNIHKELEKKIAAFHGTEDACLYGSCFDANAGLFETLYTKEDAVISDALNHASIIDGIRLCKAQRYRYNHMDMADLEEKLKQAQDARFRLVVTDGVFSMDGDVAPLKEIVELAEKYDAQVFIDEAHATGFFGKTGRGSAEYAGVEGRVDIINSTLGKALGGASGGYTAASKQVTDLLRQKSRPYLFSNSVAPALVGASLEMFDMLTTSSELVEKLADNTHRFRTKMADAGFTLSGAHDHAIVPIMLGDAKLAADFSDDMLTEGIYVIGFSFPVVPKGKARIRVQISAGHSDEQIDFAVNAFTKIGKRRNVI